MNASKFFILLSFSTSLFAAENCQEMCDIRGISQEKCVERCEEISFKTFIVHDKFRFTFPPQRAQEEAVMESMKKIHLEAQKICPAHRMSSYYEEDTSVSWINTDHHVYAFYRCKLRNEQ